MPLPATAAFSSPATPPQQPGAGPPTAKHAVTALDVQGTKVPVALWYPEGAAGSLGEPKAQYEYVIDIGGIARNLRVGWLLGWLPRRDFALDRVVSSERADLPRSEAKPGDAIMFTHGFLGSPLDMAHICEALAERGFTVAAPEFPESLSASYRNENGLKRAEIVAAVRDRVAAKRWGIFGHSAGAGTALTQPGEFVLGRAALCPGFRGYNSTDPLLVIASEGDAVNKLLVSNGVDVQQNLPQDTVRYKRAGEIFAEASPPRRGALIYTAEGELPRGASQLPNHLSFLWSGVDESMVDLLAPLLPVAKALRLFVLDFDTYLDARDADTTAGDVAPAVLRFFSAGSR